MVYTELETLVSLYRTLQISATGRGRSRAKLFTCGFDLARFSILIQASSRSFDFAFSLQRGGGETKSSVVTTSEHPAADVSRPLVNWERKEKPAPTCFSQP